MGGMIDQRMGRGQPYLTLDAYPQQGPQLQQPLGQPVVGARPSPQQGGESPYGPPPFMPGLSPQPYSTNPFGGSGPTPQPAWGGGMPQSFYDMRGLNDIGLLANNYVWNQSFDAPWGDVRQATRNLGFEGSFGQGRMNDWLLAGSPAEDRRLLAAMQAEIPQVRGRRMDYAQQAYPGINPDMWEGYVQPGQIHPEYDAPFGVARGAMRNLGFEGQFGGGRGGAFQQEVGVDAVRDEIARMTERRPYYEQTAFVPNYSQWFNPYNFLGGAQPDYSEPWHFGSTMENQAGTGGAGQFLRPSPQPPPPQQQTPTSDWYSEWERQQRQQHWQREREAASNY